MVINCCPYCGGTNIAMVQHGYSAKKGLFGVLTIGLLGGLAGLHGSKKLEWRCANCHSTFGEPATKDPDLYEEPSLDAIIYEPVLKHQQQQKKPLARSTSKPPVVKSRLICTCGAYNSIYNKTCFSCGAALSLASNKQVATLPAKGIVCHCGAKNSLTHKHCIACGVWLDYSQLEQQNGQPAYKQQPCPHCGADTPAKSRKVQYCAHCGEPL